jgi:hypothetical protein
MCSRDCREGDGGWRGILISRDLLFVLYRRGGLYDLWRGAVDCSDFRSWTIETTGGVVAKRALIAGGKQKNRASQIRKLNAVSKHRLRHVGVGALSLRVYCYCSSARISRFSPTDNNNTLAPRQTHSSVLSQLFIAAASEARYPGLFQPD